MKQIKNLFALLILSFVLSPAASAAILTVDCASGPFTTIQSAVSSSGVGDTIVVHPCSISPFEYAEQVTITGKVGLHLVGAVEPIDVGAYASGAATLPPSPPTVIDASGIGSCIRINGGSSDISITGFRLENCSGPGVLIDSARHVAVHANRIVNTSGGGILATSTNRARFTSNAITDCQDVGILLDGSRNTYIADNLIDDDIWWGIYVEGDFNHIVGNEITNATSTGLFINSGQENRAERNTTPGLVVGTAAVNTDVTGNSTGGSLSNSGTGTDLGDNS